MLCMQSVGRLDLIANKYNARQTRRRDLWASSECQPSEFARMSPDPHSILICTVGLTIYQHNEDPNNLDTLNHLLELILPQS